MGWCRVEKTACLFSSRNDARMVLIGDGSKSIMVVPGRYASPETAKSAGEVAHAKQPDIVQSAVMQKLDAPLVQGQFNDY